MHHTVQRHHRPAQLMLTLAEKVNAIIATVASVDGELIVTFADGSEIALSPDKEKLIEPATSQAQVQE